jgi:tryptophan halogenase
MSPGEQTPRVLIVGGGSSGWMAAAYLDARLNRDGQRRASIAVVESPDIPRIGVGEATVPSIRHILSVIGIDEAAFLERVDGTFKQAIRFTNWLRNDGSSYYHPFNRFRESPLDRSTLRWLLSDRSLPFAATVSAQPALCDACFGPRTLDGRDFGPPLSYAYHMNALKFADLLRDIAVSRGVTHHLDHVVDVARGENGDIDHIRTRGDAKLAADLFIDCSGFAGLLIEKCLDEPWIDCSRWLLNDRAVTMAVPYDRHYPGYVRPFTTATAMSAGWTWDIPLQNRRSLGYVHSSAYLDEDEAVRELRKFEGPHSESLETRTVRFRVGVRERAWVRNCVAIGLAGGFIEPLESTGLYLSDLATVMLAEHFPLHGDVDGLRWRYNRIMISRYYEILDFINLHFALSGRDDTDYWREVRKPARRTARLQAKLDYWRTKPPSVSDFEDAVYPNETIAPLPGAGGRDSRHVVDTGTLFGLDSYEAILYGLDFLRDECDRWYGSDRPPSRVAAPIQARVAAAPERLAPHAAWLQQAAGMPRWETTET